MDYRSTRPAQNDYVPAFHTYIRLVPDGALTPALWQVPIPTRLHLGRAKGIFKLQVDDRRAHLFVATGTGIAPFRSILQANPAGNFTLIFGARHEAGLLYNDEWRRLEQTRAHFEYRPTLTRPPDGWRGRTGRVHDYVIEALGDRRDVDIYICGLREMVDELRARLKTLGVDRRRIVYERYD